VVFDMSTGRINHIGIATKSLDEAETLWSALGFTGTKDEEVAEQGVRIRHMSGSQETRIELLEPISDDSPIGRFIEKRGEGIQQIAVDVLDMEAKIEELMSMGIRMINKTPLIGSGGSRIAFIHPSSCGGVLVELVEIDKQES